MSSSENKILDLLRIGKSYREICKDLKVSKSTINYWFSKLDNDTKKKIKIFRINNWKKSNILNQKVRKENILKKEGEIQAINSKKIGKLSKRELTLVGAGLYWAEGTKKDRWQLQFSNSDPFMIKLMMVFFRKICKIPEKNFYMQLVLHKNISEEKAKQYWSKITNIPPNQFKKACFSKSIASKNKRNKNNLPYGTLQIRIFNKLIVHEVYGYVNGLKNLRA